MHRGETGVHSASWSCACWMQWLGTLWKAWMWLLCAQNPTVVMLFLYILDVTVVTSANGEWCQIGPTLPAYGPLQCTAATAADSWKLKAGARWDGAKTSWYSLHLRLRPYLPFLKYISLFYLCSLCTLQNQVVCWLPRVYIEISNPYELWMDYSTEACPLCVVTLTPVSHSNVYNLQAISVYFF